MSKASRRTGSGVPARAERLQSWIAVLLTALLHLLLLLLVMLSPPITMTEPQDGATGGGMEVTYIDQTLQPPSPVHPPTTRTTPPRKPRKAAPTTTHIQTTLVTQAADPEPLRVVDIPDNATTPPDVPDEAAARPARAWGQPPGMLPENPVPANAEPARSSAGNRGRSNAGASEGTSMEVGGYRVYYDLLDDARLRAWRDQGMTQVFLPLPGTRRYMVCPLEIALQRESGECRLVQPDDPGLKTIGDARIVITMQQVYRLGEVLWRGPGPYR